MRIGLFTDLAGQRQWHRWLADDLARAGNRLVIVRPPGPSMTGLPHGLQLALWLDPFVFRLKGAHAFDQPSGAPIPDQDFAEDRAGPPFDVLIDAGAAGGPRPPAHRVIRLLFNGRSSELAAVAAILDDAPITVSLVAGEGDACEEARPAFAHRKCLTISLDNLFSVLVELLADRASSRYTRQPLAIKSPLDRDRQALGDGLAGRTSDAQMLRYLANAVSKRAANYLTRGLRAKTSWAIATRLCPGEGLVHGAWPATAAFDIIPDDGHRYYADPLIFEHEGRRHLFAEEFPLATQKGTICVAEIGSDGRTGEFRPALECNGHLSYPFVFKYGGQIWMLPESSAGGSVDLFRAVVYPGKWVYDRTLIDGVAGCDATILHDGGRYVMVLTSQRWRSTTWDNQRIFFAATPLGPWTEHPGGLIRIDSRLSRPAGSALLRSGCQLRPVQNCSEIYGGGMTLLDVRYPDGAGPQEIPIATLSAISPAGVIGTHTYACSRSVEAVDVFGDLTGVKSVEIKCEPLLLSEDQ